ncbi:hypothetical protein [Paraburkholderia sp. BL21I4N1]|uniref:hypothetical protein n=1 Tax=Paraburkholderia sp. BL21I4N1 TaxID=1938801 RepID=UPI000CFDE094|nr:hypothetical protein [Paraburkholderia sp. BL21I4N1]PQV47458.1 hypothetical protein B0G83_1104 [Paraburkholderia sp. BL21I4N1]
MRRTRPTRDRATRIPNRRAAISIASIRRFFRRQSETLSLAGGVVSIVVGSLAFWLNQPAHLFDGAAAQREASAIPSRQACDEPTFVHGVLSLELATRLRRDVPTLTQPYGVDAARRCAPQNLVAATAPPEACRTGA